MLIKLLYYIYIYNSNSLVALFDSTDIITKFFALKTLENQKFLRKILFMLITATKQSCFNSALF